MLEITISNNSTPHRLPTQWLPVRGIGQYEKSIIGGSIYHCKSGYYRSGRFHHLSFFYRGPNLPFK
jgi:hypothetical protein